MNKETKDKLFDKGFQLLFIILAFLGGLIASNYNMSKVNDKNVTNTIAILKVEASYLYKQSSKSMLMMNKLIKEPNDTTFVLEPINDLINNKILEITFNNLSILDQELITLVIDLHNSILQHNSYYKLTKDFLQIKKDSTKTNDSPYLIYFAALNTIRNSSKKMLQKIYPEIIPQLNKEINEPLKQYQFK